MAHSIGLRRRYKASFFDEQVFIWCADIAIQNIALTAESLGLGTLSAGCVHAGKYESLKEMLTDNAFYNKIIKKVLR